MEKNAKIYIAGHSGLIGSAIIRRLLRDGYDNILTKNHNELDLTDQQEVRGFFEEVFSRIRLIVLNLYMKI